MARTILYCLLVFAAGLGVGFFLSCAPPPQAQSDTDKKWADEFSEDAEHQRILKYQGALTKFVDNGAKGSAEELPKELDAQLHIEDLIIKSREAKYAKFTPFTPLFAGGLSLGRILGFLGGIFSRKRGGAAETQE